MSDVLKNFMALDKEQELLQSFMRVGVISDEEPEEPIKKSTRRSRLSQMSKPRERRGSDAAQESRDRRKSVKFADGDVNEKVIPKSNRIEAELRAQRKKIEEQMLKKKKPKENFVDFYTDKDRAAAVSAGTFDIKQSLQIKQKQDRNEALLIPDEADISSIIALGLKEIKNANPENAIHFFSKVSYSTIEFLLKLLQFFVIF